MTRLASLQRTQNEGNEKDCEWIFLVVRSVTDCFNVSLSMPLSIGIAFCLVLVVAFLARFHLCASIAHASYCYSFILVFYNCYYQICICVLRVNYKIFTPKKPRKKKAALRRLFVVCSLLGRFRYHWIFFSGVIHLSTAQRNDRTKAIVFGLINIR